MIDNDKPEPKPKRIKRRIPRSIKDITPTHAFNPRKFFFEMIWKALITKRKGHFKQPNLPKLKPNEVAITWIGHASFLIQFKDLNVLVDPNFANWLFMLKRIKRAGLKIDNLPKIDLVLISHAHYDHFHKRSLKKLNAPGIAIVPWGMGKLLKDIDFSRVIELEWWDSFSHNNWSVTLTPSKHWGARMLADNHRGYGGFLINYCGKRIFHAGDSAYFSGFKEIGDKLKPDIAILPIGAYKPEEFKVVHMGPGDALKAFKELQAKWLIPMHYGSFKLSFEDPEEPPRLLIELAQKDGLLKNLVILEEGLPKVFS